MERYKISIFFPESGSSLQLLVPFPPTSSISALAEEVKKRATRQGFPLNEREIFFRLEQEDGPILDGEDRLNEVIIDPRSEGIFVTFQNATSEVMRSRDGVTSSSNLSPPGFKIRVITPRSAKSSRDVNSIPLLSSGRIFGGGVTLREIRALIIEFLGISVDIFDHPQRDRECNCMFARRIHERGQWEKVECRGHYYPGLGKCAYRSGSGPILLSTPCAICEKPLSDHEDHTSDDSTFGYQQDISCGKIFVRTDTSCNHVLHSNCAEAEDTWNCPLVCFSNVNNAASLSMPYRFIVVHGKSNVEWMEADLPNQASILAAVRGRFGNEVEETKAINFVGSMTDPSSSESYLKLPVVSLCSRRRHTDNIGSSGVARPTQASASSEGSVERKKILDLHISEIPIETTKLDLTIGDIGLRECTINGVLNIYAVQRTVSSRASARGSGQDAIFMNADFWECPISQTDRGMAAFLSSLRLFTDRINTKKMSESSQDAILRLILLFTRFPPALRAVHTLMNAKSPRKSECAALVQALYQVVKDIVPLELVQSDEGRILEGSRLLFGFLLDRATQVAMENVDQNYFPYLWSLKTIDLKNSETMEPVGAPIMTSVGLVEEGYYEAYKQGGMLSWCNGQEPLEELRLDHQTRRITLLCGGMVSEVTLFDSDSLSSLPRNRDHEEEELLGGQAFSNLNNLATICGRSNFAVVPPADLPSSNAPALTLDRDGLLAVYVGRAPCASPGKDIAIFCPTKGGEENVDVSIITQIITPILQQRSEDGTGVFDLFGGAPKERAGKPDELIMFCVDCSNSMGRSSDFEEIKDEENSDESEEEEEAETVSDIENDEYPDSTLDEMKDMILNYESFEDILAIVKNTPSFNKPSTVSLILEYMSTLFSRELSHVLGGLKSIKAWATVRHFRLRGATYKARAAKLKSQIAGLDTHKKALCDFLLFRAEAFNGKNQDWIWKVGDEIPKWPKKPRQGPELKDLLVIPHEYICPIGREVFEDPVTASDGFTYERSSITRWFQFRKSSPSTGLDIDSVDVKLNAPLAEKVKKWVNGEGLLESPGWIYYSRFRETKISIIFFSRLGSFSRQISKGTSVFTLYRLAFQGMKGRYPEFDLKFNGRTISSARGSALPSGLATGSTIHINVHETLLAPAPSERAAGAEFEEISLIKVYEMHDRDNVLFSYWVSKNTANTIASINFRHWRYRKEKDLVLRSYDTVLWTGMVYLGDGAISGNYRGHHWDSLSEILTPTHATGNLGKEELIKMEMDPEPLLDATEVEPSPESSQQPLVLKVLLSTWQAGRKKKRTARQSNNLSRMDVSKQIFDSFINRTLAYNYPTHAGLVTFDSTAKVSQPLTNVLEDFRNSVDTMKPRGDTALWDALMLANDQLREYGEKFPDAKKRIICLSDGEDNKSLKKGYEACWSLVDNEVVVDSFCLGDVDNASLRTISYLSGGYKFLPKTLEQAMSICEMEPVLNQLERPPIVRRPVPRLTSVQATSFSSSRQRATPDTVTRDTFPERRQHPNLDDQFVSLSAVAHSRRSSLAAPGHVAGGRSNSHLRPARLLSELRNIVANPHSYYDVYVSESNMGFWKVVMQGPPGSSYHEGTFVLYLHMEDNYPIFPPKGRFCTPIIHPNINRHGRICHSILDRNWTLDTTNLQVINTVYSLLLEPERSDPVDTVVTLNYHWDEVAFQEDVKAHIRKYAMKSREIWKGELLGE